MGQEITTYSKVLTKPINVSFTCEHCGEYNSFAQEIVGSGSKSKYGGKHEVKSSSILSQKELDKIMMKSQKNLDYGIKNAEIKIAKGKFSWLYANKCIKCNYYQSWQTHQIWKNFFKTFIGGPFMSLLIVMFPLSIVFGRDSDKYPDWI